MGCPACHLWVQGHRKSHLRSAAHRQHDYAVEVLGRLGVFGLGAHAIFDHQLLELGRNRPGLRDITQLHPLRFPQLDTVVRIKHSLSGSAADVDVNRGMRVAVEKESNRSFFKNLRHQRKAAINPTSGQFGYHPGRAQGVTPSDLKKLMGCCYKLFLIGCVFLGCAQPWVGAV